MKLVYKIWLMNDIGRTFGEGPYLLLKGVERTGSLKEAAARTGMAYSKARRVMECCERSLGFALTVRKKGGVTGGGSEVTAEAAELMNAYESLRTEIEEAIGRTYEKHFGHEVPVEFHKMITQKRGPPEEARGVTGPGAGSPGAGSPAPDGADPSPGRNFTRSGPSRPANLFLQTRFPP